MLILNSGHSYILHSLSLLAALLHCLVLCPDPSLPLWERSALLHHSHLKANLPPLCSGEGQPSPLSPLSAPHRCPGWLVYQSVAFCFESQLPEDSNPGMLKSVKLTRNDFPETNLSPVFSPVSESTFIVCWLLSLLLLLTTVLRASVYEMPPPCGMAGHAPLMHC